MHFGEIIFWGYRFVEMNICMKIIEEAIGV